MTKDIVSNARELLDERITLFTKTLPTDVKKIGDQFDHFCVNAIHKDRAWSFSALSDGITDGSRDAGIDAFYLMVNGQLISEVDDLPNIEEGVKVELHLMQMKHDASVEESVIAAIKLHIDHILQLKPDDAYFAKHVNKRLQGKLELFRAALKKYDLGELTFIVRIFYCCRGGQPNEQAISLSDELCSLVKALIPGSEVRFEFFGAAKILEIDRKPPKSKKLLKVSNDKFISSNPGPSYLMLVNLADFVEFIILDDNLNQSLFEFNVRDFEGPKRLVNKAIAKTVQNRDDNSDFWWFNNGITVLCQDARPDMSDGLDVTNPMIVNGLQTSNVLFLSRNQLLDGNEKRSVVIKLVKTNSDDVQEGVIEATNSQTTLKALALRASDPVQKQIEEYLANNKVYYERRKNYYKNRQKPAASIIDITRMAQMILAVDLQLPNVARARPASHLREQAAYESVFDASLGLKTYLNAALLDQKISKFFRKNREVYESHYLNNLRFHTSMLVVMNLANMKIPRLAQLDLKTVTDVEIEKALKSNIRKFDKIGGEDSDAKAAPLTAAIISGWRSPKAKSS